MAVQIHRGSLLVLTVNVPTQRVILLKFRLGVSRSRGVHALYPAPKPRIEVTSIAPCPLTRYYCCPLARYYCCPLASYCFYKATCQVTISFWPVKQGTANYSIKIDFIFTEDEYEALGNNAESGYHHNGHVLQFQHFHKQRKDDETREDIGS